MEDLCRKIIELSDRQKPDPEYQASLKELQKHLSYGDKQALMAEQASTLAQHLTGLDPCDHALGFSHLLAAKADLLPADEVQQEWFLTTAAAFFQKADGAQLRLAGGKFAKICATFVRVSLDLGKALEGILPLRAAMQTIRPAPACLTPAHVGYLQLCLQAQFYHAALPYVEESITQVDPCTGLQARDILLYFLFAGRVFIGLKRFQEACRCFAQATRVPCKFANAILLEIHKKHCLTALLASGMDLRVVQFPQCPQQGLKQHAAPYDHFCTLVRNEPSSSTASSHLEKQQELLTRDGNWGLAKQCMTLLRDRQRYAMSKSHISASLARFSKLHQMGSMDETEIAIREMVATYGVDLKISQTKSAVWFGNNTENTDEPAHTSSSLHNSIHATFNAMCQLQTTSTQIAKSRVYIQATAANNPTGALGDISPSVKQKGNPNQAESSPETNQVQ